MDYKETLIMNKTNFEMRGNLPAKEPLIIKKWEEIDLYNLMNENRKGCPEYTIHDGPPYANGDIHCGHMLNRILKDFILRYHNMRGYKTPFTFGWDTHGLPIENQVTKSGVNRKTTPIVDFRKKCEAYALNQVNRQKAEIKRLGVLGDYANPYLTLNKDYEASQIECFSIMALKGLIYKGLKPVYWSPSSESALAEAEIEYKDVLAHSIYVAFKVKDGKDKLPNDARVVIWTTTPWTLPANLAISVHPEFIYGLYETDKGKLVFLQEFEDYLVEELELNECRLIKTFFGKELEYIVCSHPFYDRDSIIIVGRHVTSDAGTGLVHTAPGHGVEDYQVCLKYKGLDPYCPVDSKGYYDDTVGDLLKGKFYEEGNDIVLKIISENGSLLKHTTFTHSYPHDWRTGKPLIFRATKQWFCSIDPIRNKLIEKIHEVNWAPHWGENRMVKMIQERGDWCISRQRAWGVPIPIIYNEDGSPIIEKEVFDHIIKLVKENGSNVWYEKEAKDLLPKGYTNKLSPNGEFTKEIDIMDVWFDSGSSFNNVIKERGHNYPADLYLEGSDQFRGWFNSSLIISVACFDKAPYKLVMSHGWVLDEHGEQMHKSKGNGVDPLKVADMYGGDVLRLWALSVDSFQDVRIGNNAIKQVADAYRKIRNIFKFISWNLVDFDPKKQATSFDRISEYILAKLERVVENYVLYMDPKTQKQSEGCLSVIGNFMSNELSSFYCDISKDILYCDAKDSPKRNEVQTVLYRCGETLLRLFTPILPFTMEEVNANLPGERKVSPQLLDFPEVTHNYSDDVIEEYNLFTQLRSDVLKAFEEARNAQLIGSPLEADLKIEITDSKVKTLFDKINKGDFKCYFIASGVEVVDNLKDGNTYNVSKIKVKHHEGHFCERCWGYSDDAILQEDGTYLCPRCHKVMEKFR